MDNVIYLGRHVSGVMTNQLFTTRPNDLIETLSVDYPLIGLLFVPVEEYAAAIKELATPGSALAIAYEQTKGGGVNG